MFFVCPITYFYALICPFLSISVGLFSVCLCPFVSFSVNFCPFLSFSVCISPSVYFCPFLSNYVLFSLFKSVWCYYPHKLIVSVSPVGGILNAPLINDTACYMPPPQKYSRISLERPPVGPCNSPGLSPQPSGSWGTFYNLKTSLRRRTEAIIVPPSIPPPSPSPLPLHQFHY